jgi:epoxide hydrolase
MSTWLAPRPGAWVDVNDRGGHFAVLEEPGILTDDIREFFRGLR